MLGNHHFLMGAINKACFQMFSPRVFPTFSTCFFRWGGRHRRPAPARRQGAGGGDLGGEGRGSMSHLGETRCPSRGAPKGWTRDMGKWMEFFHGKTWMETISSRDFMISFGGWSNLACEVPFLGSWKSRDATMGHVNRQHHSSFFWGCTTCN